MERNFLRDRCQEVYGKIFDTTYHKGNANQNINEAMRHHLILLVWHTSQKPKPNSAGENVGRKEPSLTISENIDWFCFF